jgi:hypothetical protein
MGRPKKAAITLTSIDECVAAMDELLRAQTDIEALEAERALAMASASAKFETFLDDARTRRLNNEVALKNYYYAHLQELERDGAKHFRLVNGVIGRRDNPPALKPLSRNWTWASIKVAVFGMWQWKYFHPAKERELDKDALKALPAEDLKKVGLVSASDEEFYAKPDRPEKPGEVRP